MKKVLILATALIIGTFFLEARVYCKYIKSCKEACSYLQKGYTSLDRDHDGIPCENVCSKPCKAQKSKKSSKKRSKKK